MGQLSAILAICLDAIPRLLGNQAGGSDHTIHSVLNQTIMAVPLMLFYEVGIQLLVLFEKKRKKREEAEAAEDASSATMD